MLRSLYSGISGLRAHQTMLDVTGNNIANVNTAGFKSSSVQFEDTLSQLLSGATAPGAVGGTNPAQIGLGVRTAAISTNFTQGSAQATGKPTDLMINGDGFFNVKVGGQNLYTRAGDFNFDSTGTLVSAGGGFVQGWTADGTGAINTNGALGNIKLPVNSVVPAAATTKASFAGNLPGDAAAGTTLTRDVPVYDASGTKSTLSVTLTADGTGTWTVNDGASNIGTLSFSNGLLTSMPTSLTTGTGIPLDFSTVSGYSTLSTIALESEDGHASGTLQSYSIGNDGTISGSYSNGVIQAIARIAVTTFTNPGGLEKQGGSSYAATSNSGTPITGSAGSPGIGSLTGGYLEASNVDLSQEFTDLIVAQRGFQANARIITTSDSILQELVDLKRQ
ncbi:MAG: flagellar hook protein FlgE [Microbacteriaceae bacterium]|nr:MAG: flagellar hook protein FlgE [Microbacteriaceae bacterium]